LQTNLIKYNYLGVKSEESGVRSKYFGQKN